MEKHYNLVVAGLLFLSYIQFEIGDGTSEILA